MVPLINRLLMRIGIRTERTNSPDQHQTARVSGTGNTVSQVHNTYNSPPVPAPNLALQIYGDCSTHVFRGQIRNTAGRMLVIESIEIAGEITQLEQALNNLYILPSLAFPAEVFTTPMDAIPLSMKYRTLEGERFEYALEGRQTDRVAGGYDVPFPGPPSVRYLE